MAEVFFFLAAIGALAGAIGTVALRNPFYSVLSLVCHLLSLAALFLLLRAEFLAAAQVIVYVGAVMVLYLFVVAYVGGGEDPIRAAGSPGLRWASALFAGALFVELSIAVLGTGLTAFGEEGSGWFAGYGTPGEIGRLLLTDFLLAFEAGDPRAPAGRPGASARDLRRRDAAPRQPRRDDRRRGRHDDRGRRAAAAMNIEWYLVVSALVFCIGAGGILVRRNPLVILLCLELMLNAGNLALVAFARAHGNQDGQIFALVVMVVAACEVAVGLGLIVAIYRRRLPIDVDELRELQG
jgi:NADH:ubiquinone oxidoreductase subunit K/NADH:ubiquinone oxidoreductase subunit 6 (subunit J)